MKVFKAPIFLLISDDEKQAIYYFINAPTVMEPYKCKKCKKKKRE